MRKQGNIVLVGMTMLIGITVGSRAAINWEEMGRHGMMPPKTYNFDSAKKIINATLEMTARAREAWWMANGMLGASRIPANTPKGSCACRGYNSLFSSGFASSQNTKMERVATGPCLDMLVLTDHPGCNSWVCLRERYIGRIGYYLNTRFQVDGRGFPGRILSSVREHKSHEELTKFLGDAYALYRRLEGRGYEDRTLGDAIGIVSAFLDYDGLMPSASGIREIMYLPATSQTYADTARSVIEDMRRGQTFYSALAVEMGKRNLHRNDIIAFPDDEAQHKVLLSLIREDLNGLEKTINAAAVSGD
ncbi:MAG TPA: hypothetical protein P5079_01940 [Elusimicrobiota bacterium]|nr:hypothetical protein [Elusimicrobiota bacterium]